MVKVAIAGGTSPTLGRSIVSAILHTKSHQPIILSRVSSTTSDTKYGASVVAVDYDFIDSLTTALKTHEIDVVVSVLKIVDPLQNLKYHRNLLDACIAAKAERFILSDWSLASPSWTKVDALQNRVQMQELCSRGADVECSMIQVGGFLEYFAQGCGDLDGLQAGLEDDLMLDYINVTKGRLIIPCKDLDGQKVPAKVSMTSLWDIGHFVAASLDLPKGRLGTQVGIVGDIFDFESVRKFSDENGVSLGIVSYVTYSECLEIVHKKGAQFDKKIQAGRFDLGLFKEKMAAQMYACLCEEETGGGIVTGLTLNELCPSVQTTSIDDLLGKAWGRSRTLESSSKMMSSGDPDETEAFRYF